ncbi:MAG: polysaccharide deacetylase family protein [Clostridia bacterium]|nr:polysaccharide deacetylase family protein [Clostridia bacterium]MBQ9856331.1 polysaccharide deacetylase family protein [Clostridia bacterium]
MQNKRYKNPPVRRKQPKRKKLPLPEIILGATLLVALIVVLCVLTSSPKQEKKTENTHPTTQAEVTPAPTPPPSPAPEATPAPVSDIADPVYAALRPTAKEGWLPVFDSIDTTEKVIAITVDDCYQGENLWEIIRLAQQYGAKLTFFPIGEVLLQKTQSEALLYAWQNGFEIENHTFTHNNLFQCSDEELAKEVYNQNLALSKILGVEYSCHFLRPMGGDAKNDQRIHAYIRQLGYKGISHWSESGTRSLSALSGILKPGQVYLFHTTDKDLRRLQYFIPYAVENGYRLVTLNELFGYPANETKPLETPIENRPVPTLAPYQTVRVPYTNGSHAYGVVLVQKRLIELGYLENGADGIYGENTAKAVEAFQTQVGLTASGKADVLTQENLFSESAPRYVQ